MHLISKSIILLIKLDGKLSGRNVQLLLLRVQLHHISGSYPLILQIDFG